MSPQSAKASERLINLLKANKPDRAKILAAMEGIEPNAEVDWQMEEGKPESKVKLPWLAVATLALAGRSFAPNGSGKPKGSSNLVLASFIDAGADETLALSKLARIREQATDNPALQDKILGAIRTMNGAVILSRMSGVVPQPEPVRNAHPR